MAGQIPGAKELSAAGPAALGSGGRAGGQGGSLETACDTQTLSSPFVPVDSWIYPAILRLYGLGFVDHVLLGMRPWTRSSINRMLEDVAARIEDAPPGPEADQAEELYEVLAHAMYLDVPDPCLTERGQLGIESVYTVARAVSGKPLRDSYHLGSTIINDYGRPYAIGLNCYTGASAYASLRRLTVYVRGEFRGAQSEKGYSASLAEILAVDDGTFYTDPITRQFVYYPQATIPLGPLDKITNARFLEAYVSTRVQNHEISVGKQDEWMGPAQGGGFAYSNNAENILAFHINRVEPLHVPGLSYVTGPFRYEFLLGGLRGHTFIPNSEFPPPPGHGPVPNVVTPGNPWVHIEKVSFRPTNNLEFGFERTAIWGGKGHAPITVHTFLKSFFSFASPSAAVKYGRDDPGARFGAFDFSYRLPFLRNWITLYADGEVHDDVSPIDAPRRASWRPGLYLSHVPSLRRLDVRMEAVETDPPVSTSQGGRFMYFESIQEQGYTNAGQLFGDWIGREDKGGQAWITYHLSGNEWLQLSARNQKAAKDFIRSSTTQYGTTLNDISFQAVKWIGKDFEIDGRFTFEQWKAPIYPTGNPTDAVGRQTVTTTTIQFTWFPQRKVSF